MFVEFLEVTWLKLLKVCLKGSCIEDVFFFIFISEFYSAINITLLYIFWLVSGAAGIMNMNISLSSVFIMLYRYKVLWFAN